MVLNFVRFTADDYPEYKSWFADADLNAHLGPMDQDWLDAVLAERDEDGAIWAVFEGETLVAVVEIGFDPRHKLPAVICAIATKPALRRRGIARAVLREAMRQSHARGIREHQCVVEQHNAAARRLVESEGFQLISAVPDDHGYLRYSHRRAA